MDSSQFRHDSIKKERTLLIGVISTALSLFPTVWVTYLSNSIVLLGDFLRCLVEFIAILLSWLVIRHATHSDKTFYDYGFAKLERVAGLVVSGAMFMSFFVVAFCAINRLISPVPLENTRAGLALAILAIFGNSYLWLENRKVFLSTGSPVMESQWKLFRAKALASLVVVATLTTDAILPHSPYTHLIDPCGSLFLAAFLFYSAVGLFSESIADLVDRSVDETLRLSILKGLVDHESKYVGFRSLRARRAGTTLYVEIFLEFDAQKSLSEISLLCESIRCDLARHAPQSEITIIPCAP